MKKLVLYVDMDGTLCEFDSSKTIEEVAAPGYCRNLNPIENVINAITTIPKIFTNIEVRILSAYINENAIIDKMYWLRKNLGADFAENALFVPCGTDKSIVIDKEEDISFLLDDFSTNLHGWAKGGGIGIKVFNGINGNNGTWNGYSIHSSADHSVILKQIMGIIHSESTLGMLI